MQVWSIETDFPFTSLLFSLPFSQEDVVALNPLFDVEVRQRAMEDLIDLSLNVDNASGLFFCLS